VAKIPAKKIMESGQGAKKDQTKCIIIVVLLRIEMIQLGAFVTAKVQGR
jgi:hypothetical protein